MRPIPPREAATGCARSTGRLVRLWLAVVAVVILAGGARAQMPAPLSETDEALYRSVFLSLDAGTSAADAAEAAQAAADDALAEVLGWLALVEAGEFPEIAVLLEERPNWPRRTTLRLNAERSIPDDADPAAVAEFFARHPPLTAVAAARYEEVLRQLGRDSEAQAYIRSAWPRLALTADQLALFAAYFPFLEGRDHAARLSALIDADRLDEARAMLSLLEPRYGALLEARVGLAQRAWNVNELVAAVPEALRDDPGLVFDRLRWRRQAGLLDGAVEMLEEQPADGSQARWWTERRAVARQLLAIGDAERAYAVARGHRQDDGLPRYQAEFLAGWLALQHLRKPQDARMHFRDIWDNALTPIGRATGAYWLARTEAALGNADEAHRWWTEAAARPTTYYGQLAAQHAGVAPPVQDPPTTPEDEAAFGARMTTRIVAHLHQIGQRALRDRFFEVLLAECETPGEYVLAARLAARLGVHAMQVAAADTAAARGHALAASGYPTIGLDPDIPDRALTLAIIRQESGFDPAAVSPAGAQGYMQLLPATGRLAATALDLTLEDRWLIDDPALNVRLGSEYMRQMLEIHDGSLVLASAAYNAGPTRVSRWLMAFGDPRIDADPVDWVERIPFHETRNYVQRIVEGEAVYRRLLEARRTDPLMP